MCRFDFQDWIKEEALKHKTQNQVTKHIPNFQILPQNHNPCFSNLDFEIGTQTNRLSH